MKIIFESKTYKEQVDILQNKKGIDIISEPYCISILKQYGYFNLINNYKHEIYSTLVDEKLSINDIIFLREIDNDLQSIIFKNLIKIETTFKSHLSYLLATKFGVRKSEYTDEKNYRTHLKARELFYDITNKKHIDFTKGPANHYLDKYNDMPPWVYLKHLPLGDAINIYDELEKVHKLQIIDSWLTLEDFNEDEKCDFFAELIKFIKDFRNTIAHGGRLLNYKSEKIVKKQFITKLMKPGVINNKNFSKYQGQFFLLLLVIIISLPSQRDREKFVFEIRNTYSSYLQETENHFIDMFLKVSNLPTNFISKLLSASNWDIPTV